MPPSKIKPTSDKVAILIWNIPERVRHDFKVACASQGTTMRDALVGLMSAYIKKYNHA